ncbi:phosphopantetheine-binding protein [Puniceicoccaceae bacterium K14]|nr:phosphopantetheine-binding protein [Puniceicoccaceae bacterium K14]
MSDQTQTTTDLGSAPAPGSVELLKDTLKRCSPKTIDAALKFRETKDPSLVSAIVLGIVERFLEPEMAEKLNSGDDSLNLMEDLGLDSLTMIEAIMMVEEALGVSIKNEELISLRTIQDLKEFIDMKMSGSRTESKGVFYPLEEIAAEMPHQEPFLFLSEANLDRASANGCYRITGQEAFLKGHFKDNPVFPASIMLEALGQLAVFSLLKGQIDGLDRSSVNASEVYFTGADGVRCSRICKPGETLDLEVSLKRLHLPLAVFSGKITVGGEKAVVVEEITLAFAQK